jgi:hypothetical protein
MKIMDWILCVCFGLGASVVLVDWAGGCGETWVVKDRRIQGDCVGTDAIKNFIRRLK